MRPAPPRLPGPGERKGHPHSATSETWVAHNNMVVSQSTASLERDLPQATIYTYDGPHGVGINACPPALDDFLANL